MNSKFSENKTYKNINFLLETSNISKEYYRCTFVNCNFEQLDLSEIWFEECKFMACNLSRIQVKKANFQNVSFVDSKLLGISFSDTNPLSFEIHVEKSVLDFSSFYQLDLKTSSFTDIQLHEVDFVETNLEGVQFENCDFLASVFENTNFKKTDLSSSYNFVIDPEQNKMNQCKLSTGSLLSLLTKYNLDIID